MTSTQPTKSSNNVKINDDQKLYVIQCGSGSGESLGYSCMGFQYCFDQATALAERMNLPQALTSADFGKMSCYHLYLDLLSKFDSHPASKKTWFDPKTPRKVQTLLEAARKDHFENGSNADVLRIFFGDPETGIDWAEENDTVGFIGRSTGMMKVPLLVEPLIDSYGNLKSASGGGSISTASIVRIINVTKNKEVYRHSSYELPYIDALENLDDRTSAKCPYVAVKNGEVQARFKDKEEALEYIAFIQGFKAAREYRTVREYREEMDFV